MQRYVALLAGPAADRGLIGPREIDRVWERHILNCAVVAELVPAHARLWISVLERVCRESCSRSSFPDVSVILVDSMLRRSVFLSECVKELGLANVEVRRGRAEDLAGELSADVVIARAVAPLRRLVEWAVPLVRPGGTILAIKGDRAREELGEATERFAGAWRPAAEILAVGQDKVEPETVVIRIVAGGRKGRAVPGSRTGSA